MISTPRALYISRIVRAAAASVVLLTLATAPARAETWAERLGYPPGAKVLILHADQMGLAYETNAAGQALAEQGAVYSASAMAPCPWFADYAAWTRDHPDADVGLALTLNSDRPRYRWQPLASDNEVASLVDQDGFLWPSVMQTLVNAEADEVARELHAQIHAARMAGLHPTHFTTYLGALFARADLAELYLQLAQQYWIPAVVVELTPAHVERFRRLGFPLPDELVAAVEAYPLPKVDDMHFVPLADSYEDKRAQFLALIDGLAPGLTSITMHPAIESAALERIVDDENQRIWETRLMQDPAVQARLAADDVILTTWREIMQRFNGAPPAPARGTATSTPGVGPAVNAAPTAPFPTLAPNDDGSDDDSPVPTPASDPAPRPVPDGPEKAETNS